MAVVSGAATRLAMPVRFGEREYALDVRFRIRLLAPWRTGVEISPLVSRLATFSNPEAWGARLRRALLPLAEGDGDLLLGLLTKLAPAYPVALPTYRDMQPASKSARAAADPR
jgi:hypothetical protein